MEIKINAQEIDKYIKETLIKSSIGEALQKTINETVKTILDRYDTPVKKVVYDHVSEIVSAYLNEEENKKIIYESIVALVNPETIKSIVEHGLYKLKQSLS